MEDITEASQSMIANGENKAQYDATSSTECSKTDRVKSVTLEF